MKKTFKLICIVLCTIVITVTGTAAVGKLLLPNEITVYENTEIDFGEFYKIESEQGAPVFKNGIGEFSAYNAQIKILGIVPIKTLKVSVEERKKVEVCGSVFGLRIYSDGVTVVDTDTVETADGAKQPAFDAGFMKGDIITEINGEKVYTSDNIASSVNKSAGNDVSFTVKRGNDSINITVKPAKDRQSGAYRAGLWLRDSAAGIGTMTFYDPETNVFAGLGHSVCDIDTGLTVALRQGDILTASVNSVSKGGNGNAGEISGTFGNTLLGVLSENGDRGVYGVLQSKPVSYGAFPVADKEEIKTGYAEVITSIDNDGPKKYSIEIVNIDTDSTGNKNMTIKITDNALLAVTGGIIQGMSGSPIIQNGMLAGAVTHVFLNDNTKGYAIFAENMFENAEKTAMNPPLKNAS